MRCKLIGLPAMVRTTRNRSSPDRGVTAAPHVIRLSFDRQDDQLFLSPCPPCSIGARTYCHQTYTRGHAQEKKPTDRMSCTAKVNDASTQWTYNVNRRSKERGRHCRTPQTRAGERCARRPPAADSGRPYRAGCVAPLGSIEGVKREKRNQSQMLAISVIMPNENPPSAKCAVAANALSKAPLLVTLTRFNLGSA